MEAIVCPVCKKTSSGDLLHCYDCGASLSARPTRPLYAVSVSSPLMYSRSALLWDDFEPGSLDESPVIEDDDLASNEFTPPEQSTWQQVVEEVSLPPAAYPPRPPQPSQVFRFIRRLPIQHAFRPFRSPRNAFWLFMIVLLCLVSIGTFGITRSLGQGSHAASGISLQVSPQSMEIGATLTLHGSGFAPHSHIGLTRDTSIPIYDTANDTTITTDNKGLFTDTVVVLPDWQGGSHIINAEDATTHRTASFPILVDDNGMVSRPPHLKLSVTSLDFGSGDQATNNTKAIEIINTGSGQISWQTTTTQPWLLVSPTSGQFFSEAPSNVVIAVDRSNLKPGDYDARVMFASNAGSATLPIHMHVSALGLVSSPVLQVTPGALSFSSSDGSSAPDPQMITVSNPGKRTLQWNIQAKTSWLTVSPSSATIQPGESRAVTINAQISKLLPGSYSGQIVFQGQNAPTMHSPQQVYVNLTITPHCSLQASPSILTFNTVFQQTASVTQVLNLHTPKGCSNALSWHATSSAKWLQLRTLSGKTPANLTVATNPTGLAAGTYTGSITLTTSTGSQIVLVNLVVAPANSPLLHTATTALSFSAVAGQTTATTQTVIISNIGGSALIWHALSTTSGGGAWLSVSPLTGTLAAHSSTSVLVSASASAITNSTTYSGSITIRATTLSGTALPGNQSISTSFAVQAPCSLTTTVSNLTFVGVGSQKAPPAQSIPISLTGTCSHAISWTTTTSGGSWLSATSSGSISSGGSKSVSITVLTKGLSATAYNGTVTFIARDSVTHTAISVFSPVTVTLNIQPSCTLQPASASAETFNATSGTASTSQTVTLAVVGTCNGSVSIVPTTMYNNGTGWLTTSASANTIQSGQSVTLTLTADASSLPPNAVTYTATVSVVALNSGIAIVGSPQPISVTFNVSVPPDLQATPTALSFSIPAGQSGQPSQSLTIQNAGGDSLDWNATLQADAASVISLSSVSGTNLSSGQSNVVSVSINTANLLPGSSYSTHIALNGSDASSGKLLAGQSILVTIQVLSATPDAPTPTPAA